VTAAGGATRYGKSALLRERVQDEPYSTSAGPDGVATIELPAVPNGEQWAVERIVVGNTGQMLPECRIYLGRPTPTNLVDGTQTGRLDVAEYARDLVVPQGVKLTAQWTGATPGSLCWIRLQRSSFVMLDVEV